MLAVGSVMFPALISNGYSRSFSIGLICASGTLGIIIPPSIPMILFGIMTETSITQLFLAGIVPGLFLAFLLAVYAILINRHRDTSKWDTQEIMASIRSGAFALALPILLLGGIYSGYFTPTEAAVAALLYSLFVESLVHRELEFRDFYEIVGSTASLLGILLPLVAFATSLSVIMDYERVPQAIVAWVQTFIDSRTTFLIAANLMLLLAGAVMEVGSAIVILAPLLMPLAKVYGVDPVHFGIVMTVNLEIGYITPPVGLNLFVALAAFKASFSEVCRSVVPYIGIMLLGLTIITAVPALSLWFIR
jgi:C4-dicarboxylate transporter DctM subunit